MSSFEFDISEKDLAAGVGIMRVRDELLRAVLEARVSRADIARKLEIDRAQVTRHLKGGNLTIKTLSEICWALGMEPRVTIGVPRSPSQPTTMINYNNKSYSSTKSLPNGQYTCTTRMVSP